MDPYNLSALMCFMAVPAILLFEAVLHTVRWYRTQRQQRATFRALDRKVNLPGA